MLAEWRGVVWLLLLLGPLLFAQRHLHKEVQGVLLLLTRRIDISTMLFSILFFPGILLHESSHYVTARLLRVRTGKFSLLPKALPNGRLQLGYVETASTDWLRDALIGAAPLLAGVVFVGYVGLVQFDLPELYRLVLSEGPAAIQAGITRLVGQPDFWIWVYLVVTVSSTMLPSASDRRAWLPLLVAAAILLGVSLLAGAGPWLMTNLAPLLNIVLEVVAFVFGISLAIQLLLLAPLWLLRQGLSWLTHSAIN